MRFRILAVLLLTMFTIPPAYPQSPGRSNDELRARHVQVARQAMREAVRKSLSDAIGSEESAVYEFHITFDPRVSGAQIPDWVREQFPNQLTLVLQYRFRELVVGDEAIEVTASFNQQWERVRIPYAAIRQFRDAGAGLALDTTDGLR